MLERNPKTREERTSLPFWQERNRSLVASPCDGVAASQSGSRMDLPQDLLLTLLRRLSPQDRGSFATVRPAGFSFV